MRRLTIYAFYDPVGFVDDYVLDCVAAIGEHSEKVLFVSNGKVDPNSIVPVAALSNVEVIERPNEGLDIWGYKHGIDVVGWSELERYDEVILMNSTIAGPLYPLSEMFNSMDATDVDFWGITAHGGEDYDPWNLLPTGRIERHIQSYFMAVRQRMLQSAEFRGYWDTLSPLASYTDAVARHEVVFTHRFTELGYRWTTYIDGAELEPVSSYPLMFLPEPVLIGLRCPFFKRKALFLGAEDLAATRATSTATMVDCLARLGYDLRRVLPSVIRTNHQSDIRLALNAFVTLSSSPDHGGADLSRIRVVAWVGSMIDLLALERHWERLEECAEPIILTAHGPESHLASRLGALRARTITSATFADFAREIGRATRDAGHVLLIGANAGSRLRPEISAYVQAETGLRALAGSHSVLASGIAHLSHSVVAGALTSPLTNRPPNSELAAWSRVASQAENLLLTLGIHVPTHLGKPAWGPPSGVVLARSDMLAVDWELAGAIMAHLSDADAGELLMSVLPFIVQSRGRLLTFASSEPLLGATVFSPQIEAPGPFDRRTLGSRLRTRALREYRQVRHDLRKRLRAATQPVARP